MNPAVQITCITKVGGPLTKRIYLTADGSLKSDGSACLMGRGQACRAQFSNLGGFADCIANLAQHEAVALGSLRPDLPGKVEITTKDKLGELNGVARPDLIARTGSHIVYCTGQSALALLDFDTKGIPPDVAARIGELGDYWAALVSVVPELRSAARVTRRSTSAGIYRADTEEKLPGSDGLHVFVHVKDGTDIERFLKTLHARCWLAGFGWSMVGAGGQLLERSIVDRMVGAPERLVFEGAPVLEPPLAQDQESRRPIVTDGDVLDTVAACPPLSIVEQAKLRELRAKEATRLAPGVTKAKAGFITRQCHRLVERTGMDQRRARRVVERQCSGILLPDLVLPFDDPELTGSTVADVLGDPDRFEGATLADPLEGIEYGICKARIMRRADGTPWIHSFAHGRTVYELKYDAHAAGDTLQRAPRSEAADLFVRLVLAGDLDAAEIEDLRDIANERAEVGKRALDAKLKAARKTAAAAAARFATARRLAERRDPRPQIEVPLPDAPWLPVMGALNEVLGSVRDAEPPVRDVDGIYVKVRVRRALNMHRFTSRGANAEETVKTRLPPPEQPLLTRLSEAQLAEEIERYIDYVDATGRAVHLGGPFVHHFHTRPGDNALPLAAAIATLLITLGDGTLLGDRGLDRDRGIIFRVPNELLAIIPRPEACTPSAIAAAMRFLTDEWLVDVASDYAGKCILIAAALTVIERSVLANRPTFWVTAGRRGGGKTTVIIMLLMAVTGVWPAAAAWSPNEEERRKALLAYLLEAMPAIVWDNIPRGTQISCPHIEKSCTTAFYSDRRLGVSETVAVSAAVIHFFTGNNVGPRGDLASRSLRARLELDRPDPENRPFKHPDPIGWTEENRGAILGALYTILLGNPRLRDPHPAPPETRFKDWHHLVGSAVEAAARACGEVVRFRDLFLAQEEDDEESASLADALAVLAAAWPNAAQFLAADVAKLINTTGEWASQTERERGMTLREFLFAKVAPTHAVTAKATAKRLKRHVSEPVPKDDKTLILKEFLGTHSKVTGYYVLVK